MTSLRVFDDTMQKTDIWLKELMDELGTDDRKHTYRVLRAVLHALRDRLTVEEAAKLGAQLPMLVRGFYYEGWRPADVPTKERRREEFLQSVGEELQDAPELDLEQAVRATFRVMSRHVTRGEVDGIIEQMPQPLRELWSEAA